MILLKHVAAARYSSSMMGFTLLAALEHMVLAARPAAACKSCGICQAAAANPMLRQPGLVD